MINTVEKHRRHLCIGQSTLPTEWPKHVKNLRGGYLKQLAQIFERKKSAIGYSVTLTAASIPSTTNTEETADWYLFPDQLKISNVPINKIDDIAEKLFINNPSIIQEHQPMPTFQENIQCERLNGIWILVCCHSKRDERCGMFE